MIPRRRTGGSNCSICDMLLNTDWHAMNPRSWSCTTVRCLAGSRANERPLSFDVGDRELKVANILKSWREPDYLCFKVEGKDGRRYELRHHEQEDAWEVRESGERMSNPDLRGQRH